MVKFKKLNLEQMVKFVREVAEAALAEKRPIDAGCLVQPAKGRLCVLMTPDVRENDEMTLAGRLTEFLEEHGVVSYVYMTKMSRRTRVIFVYAADREGERRCLRWDIIKGRLDESPHEGVHPFLELFRKTLH
jgi:hypothetical protein